MNLGRYEVIRELGKGAMGIVYLAKDPLIGRLVALKTIRAGRGVDDDEAREFQQRFVREAQAAGILSHPSIVTVHDIGQDSDAGSSFIAMEYVEGKNLKEALNQGKRLTHAEVADIVSQIAEALDYAHSKGIIHRDVKPANVILCDNGRAKIMDFGIAKIASSAANLTTTGQFLGTPNYMAPEQIKGAAIDGRTDLFSLGVVLYEGLARRKPFGGDSLTSISYKIVHETFVPLRDIDPDIPEAYDVIVARALQKNVELRYQRGREMVEDLRKAARGELVPSDLDAGSQDETLMTFGPAGKLPTIELPFPESDEAAGGPIAQSAEDVETRPLIARSEQPARKKPGLPASGRAAILRRSIPPSIFFGVMMLLVILVGGASAILWSQREDIPAVDTEREALVARQRQLRVEGAQLLQAGNIEGAYRKFSQLKELAPNSPEVDRVIRSIENIRVARMSYNQRLDTAREKFDQGRQLYDQGEFDQAVAAFEEAVVLDPASQEASNFLRMSQEQMKLQQMRGGGPAAVASTRRAGPTVTGTAEPAATNLTPGDRAAVAVTLLTTFKSSATDGYLMVKADGQTIVHENIWEERRGLFRRKTPREINVYSQIPSTTGAIEVWLVIPSLNIQEHRAVNPSLRSDEVNRLEIDFDRDSKRFTARLS